MDRKITTNTDHSKLSQPQLYLSSADCGWDNLTLHAYHEPDELSDWIEPVVPEVSLIILTQGKMLMEQTSSNGTWHHWAVNQGDIFLKPASSRTKPLNWKSLSKTPMQTIHIHLNQMLIQRTLTQLTDKDSTLLELTRHSGLRDPFLTQMIYTLHQELSQPSALSQIYADTASQLLSVHLLRHYACETVEIKERQDGLSYRHIQCIRDYVDTNLGDNITLDQLAELVGFSPYHFVRLFRESTGFTPHQFIMKQRVAKAKHLLKHTDTPLSTIAIQTGFTHQSHFTQVFKRQIGLTPLAYRREFSAIF